MKRSLYIPAVTGVLALGCSDSIVAAPDAAGRVTIRRAREAALATTVVFNPCAGEYVEFSGIDIVVWSTRLRSGAVEVRVAPHLRHARGTGMMSGGRYSAKAQDDAEIVLRQPPGVGRGFVRSELFGPSSKEPVTLEAVIDAVADDVGNVTVASTHTISCATPER